jgi:hypothetical protein
MEEREREQLIDDLLERLKAEGAPEGTWLLEIDEVREALRQADDILRRLRDAIITAARDRERR